MTEQIEHPYGISVTKRLVVPAAERMLYHTHPTFGEEHIALIDYMGGDDMVVRAATAGCGPEIFPEKPDHKSLFTYMNTRGILEPFEAVQLRFKIQSSITDALHMVYEPRASVNEYSGRYSVMIDSSHLPSLETLVAKIGDHGRAVEVRTLIEQSRAASYADYQTLIGKDIELTRELSRIYLELNNDTVFFWKIDLPSLLDFIERKRALKMDKPHDTLHVYLDVMEQTARDVAPYATEVFQKNEKSSLKLTMPSDTEIMNRSYPQPSWQPQETRRVTNANFEQILFMRERYDGENGMVQAVDYMGDDHTPAETARISYGSGTRRVSEDRHLIRYLMRHRHTTPFEHVVVAFEGHAPVFVDPRQAGRHRTLTNHSFMGETIVGSIPFLPEINEMAKQSAANKQGRGEALAETASRALNILIGAEMRQQTLAEKLQELGASEDDVRGTKGVGFYTPRWRIGTLHNWCHYFGLRVDPHAQREIQMYAGTQMNMIERLAPTTIQALKDYRINTFFFSDQELEMLCTLFNATPTQLRNLETFRPFGFVTGEKEKGTEKLSREGTELQGKLATLLRYHFEYLKKEFEEKDE